MPWAGLDALEDAAGAAAGTAAAAAAVAAAVAGGVRPVWPAAVAAAAAGVGWAPALGAAALDPMMGLAMSWMRPGSDGLYMELRQGRSPSCGCPVGGPLRRNSGLRVRRSA